MKRPVFVVGCPRSGTTLLYSMLVAAGGFAAYRKETYFFDLVGRFPDLSDTRQQQQFTRQFLEGYLGKVPGLDVAPFVRNALQACRNSHDFLPVLMTAITNAQGMDRWIEATPVHVLYIDWIKKAVPDALVVHVVRDGRDCALSNAGQGWIATLPWDRQRTLGVAALYWEWMVRRGRTRGRALAGDYCELRFEDLVADPRGTLQRLGRFIDHDLDYTRIARNPLHALKRPNTSFREERGGPDFNPVGRWKAKCSAEDVRLCEALVGPYLAELGYLSDGSSAAGAQDLRTRVMRMVYLRHFAAKQWLKAKTPLGRFMTSTRVWAEQPRPGEAPVRPIPVPRAAAAIPSDFELVGR